MQVQEDIYKRRQQRPLFNFNSITIENIKQTTRQSSAIESEGRTAIVSWSERSRKEKPAGGERKKPRFISNELSGWKNNNRAVLHFMEARRTT